MLSTACIHLLQRCNLACNHCWSESGPQAGNIIDGSTAGAVLEQLCQLGLKHISLSGGEPLLYPQLHEIISSAAAHGLAVTVTTNGLLRKRLSSLIEGLSAEGIRQPAFRVSVDGGKATHEGIRGANTYKPTLQAIEFLKDRMGWVAVNTVIGGAVENDFDQLGVDLARIGVDHWALISLAPRGRVPPSSVTEANSVAALEEASLRLRQCGFKGKLSVWNYVSFSHGYLLIEHDGRVLLPGVVEAEDWVVGTVDDLDVERVKVAISKCRGLGPTFFDWMGPGSDI